MDYDPDARNIYPKGDKAKIGFQSFERNLNSIYASAAARDIQMVVASQGCDRWDISRKGTPQLNALDRNESILRSVAAPKDLLFVEGRAALDTIASRDGVDSVYTHEVHLTDFGCEVLAGAFAKALLESGSIQ